MCPYLFVYGTRRSACDNPFARRLAREGRLVGPARMQGRLYRVGHYPAAVFSDAPGEWVTGELYRLDNPVALLAMLDRYEGCGPDDIPPYEFIRVEIRVVLPADEDVPAWFYSYNRAVPESQRILSGDFFE